MSLRWFLREFDAQDLFDLEVLEKVAGPVGEERLDRLAQFMLAARGGAKVNELKKIVPWLVK